MKLLLTCFLGTAPILNQECKILGYKPFDQFETGLYLEGERSDVYKLNLESRIASKVYVQLDSAFIQDFDQLFDVVKGFAWKEYVAPGQEIIVKAMAHQSILHAPRSIQSITHKAILTSLVGRDTHRETDPTQGQAEIFVQMIKNKANFYLNTSGRSLHNRGYRTSQWEAPIKETLAATLVRMSGRHFKHPLIDPLCGAGTILIEAAMIAKSIAPGLQRSFAFEKLDAFDAQSFQKIKADCQSRIFSGKYEIHGYDRDPEVIEKAKQNAKRAGVDDVVTFEVREISQQKTFDGYIVANPPYGKRIETGELMQLYKQLISLYED